MISTHLFVVMFSVSAFLLASSYVVYRNITNMKITNQKMIAISNAIKEGAYAYLSKQYKVITIIGFICSILIGFIFGTPIALTFLLGAFLSGHLSIAPSTTISLISQV